MASYVDITRNPKSCNAEGKVKKGASFGGDLAGKSLAQYDEALFNELLTK